MLIQRKDLKLRFIILLIFFVISILLIIPPKEKIKLGLDLQGGMYLLLKADTSVLPKDKRSSAIEVAQEIIRNRIDEFGVKEPVIQIQGEDSLLIQLPGKIDRDRALSLISRTAYLEFKLVEEDTEKIKQAKEGNVPDGYELKEFEGRQILLYKEPVITGQDLADAQPGFDNRMLPIVSLRFNSQGTKKFAKVTEENVGKALAILLDGKIKSAPVIREPILTGEAQISGRFTYDEADDLALVLKAGALPCPLHLEEERTVGALLGADSVSRGIRSMLAGIIFVSVFMIIYYFAGGVVSVLCLILNILFIFAGLSILKATLTLPGIAGIILTLGMAVDANVLILERIREELNENKPLSLAVKNGFERAKQTIFDANITTLIAAFFLFVYGTGPIRGFATTLFLGIIGSMFTALFFGRTVFHLLLERKMNKLPMLTLIKNPKINFIGLRNICLFISLVIIISGAIKFKNRGEQMFGIDFRGGQISEYKITPAVDIEQLRSLLKSIGRSDVVIQEIKDMQGAFLFKSPDDITPQLEPLLKKNYQQVERLTVTTIGPSVGSILKKKALLAIILSILGILIYVAFRFHHFDFGLAGIIALFHDILISLAFLAFFGYDISLLTVTAILTLAGYSINDTIVIYDRIREIIRKSSHKIPMAQIINTAINQTFSRTIITSLTTIFVVLCIFLLGGTALKAFSFTLLVGFITGTYSSIYIAAPLVLLFQKRTRVRNR